MIRPKSLINGRYRVERKIGEGGMAIVYQGHDLLLARDVAIKTPRPQFASDSAFRARFQREARASASLSHPNIIKVFDFDRDEVRQQFLAELGHDPAYRLDLFARDPAKGTELFQTAAKAAGLVVHADKATADRVQRKQATAYLVYTESLTAAELGELMARLSAADGKATHKAFDAVHATPATPADQRDLRDVMGTDPGLWKRPAVTADPKSVSSGTGDRIARTLTDPAGKGAEKSAVLLTFAPTQVRTQPAASRELRQYLDRRGDRRPNAVPVLIVIRQSAG